MGRAWTGADGRHRMNPDTRAVLEYVVANPGVKGDVLRALFGVRTKKRIDNLAQCLNVYSVRTPGVRAVSYFPTRGGAAIVAGRNDYMPPELRAKPHCSDVVLPRVGRFDPWPEPYLTDGHIRRSGLEYRECGSRRGDSLVYCYRRVSQPFHLTT
jgi:hypothetical protein